jgi:ribose transport system substrate-binding protein
MKKAPLVLLIGMFLPEAKVATDDRPIVIGLAAITLQHPFHAALKNAAEQTAAQLGARIVILDSQGSPSKQSDDVRSFVAKRVQGILLSAMTDELVPAIEAAVKAGIPVATVDNKANTNKVLVHVGVDSVQVGRTAAEFIINKLGNKGSVIELEGVPGWSTARDRKAGFDEVMRKSNLKILASETANYLRETGYIVMTSLIGKYPGFDAVFAANDDMILGAIDAMSAAGISPASKVTIGSDASPGAFQYMKTGLLSATIDPSPGKQAGQAVEYLVGYIKNKTKPPQQVILIKPELVTKAPVPAGS